MRKPKGFYHRYELVRRSVRFTDKIKKDWWCIVKYYGRNRGAGVRYLEGDPGPDISDELLIKRARLDDVTVPVYVQCGETMGDPYFGKYYGQK